MLDLKDVVRRLLYVFTDLMTMRRAEQESPQNKHVERALQQLNAFVFLGYGRQSTIESATMVENFWR